MEEKLTLGERGKKANEEIVAILNKYNLQIQPQVEKKDLETFISSLRVRLVETPTEKVEAEKVEKKDE